MNKPERIKPYISLSMGSIKSDPKEYYDADEMDKWIEHEQKKMAEVMRLLKDIKPYFLNRVGQTGKTEFNILEAISKWMEE